MGGARLFLLKLLLEPRLWHKASARCQVGTATTDLNLFYARKGILDKRAQKHFPLAAQVGALRQHLQVDPASGRLATHALWI